MMENKVKRPRWSYGSLSLGHFYTYLQSTSLPWPAPSNNCFNICPIPQNSLPSEQEARWNELIIELTNLNIYGASLVVQRSKRLPAMWETWVRSLGREDPLEKKMATHFSGFL